MKFPCYFCAREATPSDGNVDTTPLQYTGHSWAFHLGEHHHLPTNLCISTVCTFQKKTIRVLWPVTDKCPTGGCEWSASGSDEEIRTKLSDHLRNQHSSKKKNHMMLENLLSTGHFFWFREKFVSADGESNLSLAFRDVEAYETALALLQDTNSLALDEQDRDVLGGPVRLGMLEEELQGYNVEVEVGEHTVVDDDNPRPEQEEDVVPMQEDFVELPPTDLPTDLAVLPAISAATEYNIPIYPNLEIPPELSMFSLGILTLVHHSPPLRVLACLQCSQIISHAQHRPAKLHYEKCQKSAPIDRHPGDMEIDEDEMEGLGDLDESDEGEEEGPDGLGIEVDEEDTEMVGVEEGVEGPAASTVTGTVQHWKPLRLFLKDNAATFSKPSFPEVPIEEIPFLPSKQGYGCPVSSCSHAYLDTKRLREHLLRHQDIPEEFSTNPIKCQTLGMGPKAQYFKIFPIPPPPIVPSISEQVQSELTKYLANPLPEGHVTGPQYVAIFYKKFPYHNQLPGSVRERKELVQSLLPPVTPVSKPRQDPRNQFLALSTLLYFRDGSGSLANYGHLVQRQFGNKFPSLRLPDSVVQSSFRPLATAAAIIRYSKLFATFLTYTLAVVEDSEKDNAMYLSEEHTTAGTALLHAITLQLKNRFVLAELKNLKNLTSPLAQADPPVYIREEKFTSTLLQAFDSIWKEFHTFAVSLLMHPLTTTHDTNIYKTPLIRFLALSSWDLESAIFLPVRRMYGLMLHMQYGLKMVGLVEYRNIVHEKEDDSTLSALRNFHDLYLVQDTRTPFGLLQEPLRYAGVVAAGMSIPPTVHYNEKLATGFIHNKGVTITDYKKMVMGMVEDAEGLLDRLMLGQAENIRSLWHVPEGLVEDVSNQGATYSYLTHPFNSCFTKFAKVLTTHVCKDVSMLRRFTYPFSSDERVRWNLHAISQWLCTVDEFVLQLALLFYFTTGQPPRTPELLSAKIYGGHKGERNLFLMQDELIWFVKYTKTEDMTGTPFPVVRVAPRALKALVERYVAIVRPLQIAFSDIVGTPISPLAHFLFLRRGQVMTMEQLADGMRAASARYVNVSWSIRGWRQWIIVVSHNNLDKEARSATLPMTAMAAQASHKAAAATAHYNQQVGTTLPTVGSEQFRLFFQASRALHKFFGFTHPIYDDLPQTKVTADDRVRPAKEWIREVNEQIMEQTVPRMVDAVKSQVLTQLSTDTRLWNAPTNFVPLEIAVDVSTLEHLRKLYPDGSFRSVHQAKAVQYVLSNSPDPMLVVHPLGSGKTTIAHVPAIAQPDKMTLFLVPLVALGQSVEQNALNLGIKAKFLSMEEHHDFEGPNVTDANIVVLTYERYVANHRIQNWLQRQAASGILVRVIVDEAHTLLTDINSDFRPELAKVYRLLVTGLSIPVVFMTGTLPPRLLAQFQQLLSLHPGRTVHVSRFFDPAPNLAYSVMNQYATDKFIPDFVTHLKATLIPELAKVPTSRAIVFCTTIPFVSLIAAALGVPSYHSKLDLVTRQSNLRQWLDMDNEDVLKHLVVATTGLSLGINYPHVRHVILYGDTFSMIDFAQMAARAGRDGQRAEVTLYPLRNNLPASEPDWVRYKTTQQCRRLVLSQSIHGESITCACLQKPELCDNCRSEIPQAAPDSMVDVVLTGLPSSMHQQQMADASEMVRAIYEAIGHIKIGCAYCLFGNLPVDHTAEECRRELHVWREKLTKEVKRCRVAGDVPILVACPFCQLPQQKEIPPAMNLHLPYFHETCCDLEVVVTDALIALLASPAHRSTVMKDVPNQDPVHVLSHLLSLSTSYPCLPFEKPLRFLNLHFILLAALAQTTDCPPSIVKLTQLQWFQDEWISHLPPIDTVSLLFQIPMGENKTGSEAPVATVAPEPPTVRVELPMLTVQEKLSWLPL